MKIKNLGYFHLYVKILKRGQKINLYEVWWVLYMVGWRYVKVLPHPCHYVWSKMSAFQGWLEIFISTATSLPLQVLLQMRHTLYEFINYLIWKLIVVNRRPFKAMALAIVLQISTQPTHFTSYRSLLVNNTLQQIFLPEPVRVCVPNEMNWDV